MSDKGWLMVSKDMIQRLLVLAQELADERDIAQSNLENLETGVQGVVDDLREIYLHGASGPRMPEFIDRLEALL